MMIMMMNLTYRIIVWIKSKIEKDRNQLKKIVGQSLPILKWFQIKTSRLINTSNFLYKWVSSIQLKQSSVNKHQIDKLKCFKVHQTYWQRILLKYRPSPKLWFKVNHLLFHHSGSLLILTCNLMIQIIWINLKWKP